MKALEEKLNKEYEGRGSISIKEFHKEIVDITKIDYVKGIMDKINPLDNNEPIVLGKEFDGTYIIVDGYHRVKNKIINKENKIDAFILDIYDIIREEDTLFEFLQGLIGKNIKFINDNLLIIDNKYYQIKENEGCGGCSNGWSEIYVLPEFINRTINIKKIEANTDKYNAVYDEGGDNDWYDLFINDIKIAEINTGWGNGYYGGDFEIIPIL